MATIGGRRVVYHVVGERWDWGRPLLSWDEQARLGLVRDADWHWDTAVGFDGDMVCVYDDLASARQFQAEFGGQILAIRVAAESATEPGFHGFGRDAGGTLVRIEATVSREYSRTGPIRGFTPLIPAAWIMDRCPLTED